MTQEFPPLTGQPRSSSGSWNRESGGMRDGLRLGWWRCKCLSLPMAGGGHGRPGCSMPTQMPCWTPGGRKKHATGSDGQQQRTPPRRPTLPNGSRAWTALSSRIWPNPVSSRFQPYPVRSKFRPKVVRRSPRTREWILRWPQSPDDGRHVRASEWGRLGLFQPPHDAGDVALGAADALELGGEPWISARPQRPVTLVGPLSHHRHRMVEIERGAPRLPGLCHPRAQLRRRPRQGLVNIADRPEMAEQQPRGRKRGEQPQRFQGQGKIEVWGRGRGTQILGFLDENASSVAHVQVAAGRVDQSHVMFGMAGGVMAVQPPPSPEVDRAVLLDRPDPVSGRGRECAEQFAQRTAVDPAGTVHETARI